MVNLQEFDQILVYDGMPGEQKETGKTPKSQESLRFSENSSENTNNWLIWP